MRHDSIAELPASFEAERDMQIFFTIMNAWGVRNCHARAILGMPEHKTYYLWKRGYYIGVPRSVLDRISVIRTIDRVRQALYWSDSDWIRWLDAPNRLLDKVCPIDHMSETSLDGLIEFRGLLQRMRA